MAVQTKAWEQVGESFEELGTHLRSRFDDVSASAAADRAAFEKAVRGLLTSLEQGFDAAGKAVRDPALCSDVTKVATNVREALLSTFESAGEQVRQRLAKPVRTPAKRTTTTKPAARKTAPRKSASRPTSPPASAAS